MMFGNKKEEWECIDVKDYFDENEYGKIMTEEDKKEKAVKANTNTEFLESLFEPYLIQDEHILCVIGSGAGDNENPFEKEEVKKATKKIWNVRNVYVALFAVGVLLAIFGGIFAFVGVFIALFLAFVSYIITFVFVIGAVAIIIWAATSASKGLNYAVTNKRILSYGYKYFQSLRLNEITDVKVSMKNNNTGKITIKARGTGRDSALFSIVRFPSVNDPFRVKSIIEKAKEDLINNPNGNSDCGQIRNFSQSQSTPYNPEVPLTMYDRPIETPYKPEVPLTMYDRPIETPYNSRSSDNMND